MSALINCECSVFETASKLEEIESALAELEKIELLVGIPEERASREENGEHINNAELGFIHTMGSPIMNIPARPFIEPAIKEEKTLDRITRHMKEAANMAVSLNLAEARNSMDKAGFIAENAVKAYIVDSSHFVPNAPLTIYGGWARNKVSGKMFYTPGKHSTKPLIDTGALRQSVTHVIRESDK